MKNKSSISILIFLMFLYLSSVSFALKEETHKAINEYITQKSVNDFSLNTYLINNLGFDNGFNKVITGLDAIDSTKSREVFWWLGYGGEQEDRPGNWYDFLPWNDSRSINHFHNPLKPWSEAGLNNICSGQSSILWAQNVNQDPAGKLNGRWSWKDARAYFYAALTSEVQEQREEHFAKTFRALGQQMHLIQDASVPEHVRNDAHILRAYEWYVEEKIRLGQGQPGLWTSFLDAPITFDKAILQIPTQVAGAPDPIARIIDADKYVGTNPGITKTLNGIPQVVGLAEYTNANFLSRDTIFEKTNVNHNFDYPRPEDTLLWVDDNNKKREYLKKQGSGDDIDHLAIQSIIYDTVPESTNYEKRIGLDPACFKEYAQHLIPRAVGYSAGLLSYFFRGALEITIPDIQVFGIADGSQTPQEFTKIRAKLKNSSYIKDQAGNTIGLEEIKNGTLQAVAKYKIIPNYAPDLSNYPPDGLIMTGDGTTTNPGVKYSYSVSASQVISSLSATTPADFTFNFTSNPIPAGITDLTLQVVFNGTIGNETDNAIAVGMRDLSEPTHMVFWNLTDRFSYGKPCSWNPNYMCYDLYTEAQMNDDPELKKFNYAPETFAMNFAFKGSQPVGPLTPLAQADIPAGGHVRLIVLGDGQSSTVNYVQYTEQSEVFRDVFSGAIVQADSDGIIDATPTTTFRYHGSSTNPIPFIQHYDYGIIDCYPELAGGGCVIDESQEPAANPTSVTVHILMP